MYRPIALALFLVAACSGGADETETFSFGAEGGTLSHGDARLVIPPGALTETTEFKVTTVGNPPVPDALGLAGDVIEILPSGLTLALPATLTLAYSPELVTAGRVAVYTAPSGGGPADFVALPTTVVDATHISVLVTHFSYFGPLFDTRISNTCGPGVDCGAGNACYFCTFPICAPLNTICCDNSICLPDEETGEPATCGPCGNIPLTCILPRYAADCAG